MKEEMLSVISQVEKYRERYRVERSDTHSIGLEILHSFVIDLLGKDTTCARIFENKAENE
jgi:hypothetical protein